MQPIESILTVIERSDTARSVLARAAALARRFGATLQVFQCDSEHAYALQHQFDQHGTARLQEEYRAAAGAYLSQLCDSAALEGLQVSVDTACESPLYESILRKIRRSRPALVVRGVGNGSRHEAAICATDWELARTCPVPLLLTRGNRWKSEPVVAAAVDISGDEAPELTRAILEFAGGFARRCGGALEILHAAAPGASAPSATTLRAALERRAREAREQAAWLHVIQGDPPVALPQFVAARQYDVLALGALTHRAESTALVGTLTGRLLETLRCDVLLVKPAAVRPPAG